MRYEKSGTVELGKAEDLVLVIPFGPGIEESMGNRLSFTTNPPVASLSEFDDYEK